MTETTSWRSEDPLIETKAKSNDHKPQLPTVSLSSTVNLQKL